MCSLSYPSCKKPVRFYNIFPLYLLTDTIFGEKKLLNIKCVFWLSLQLLSVTFLTLRRIQWDTITNVHMSSRKVPVILVPFKRNWNFLNTFARKKKAWISNVIKNPSSGSWVVPCGQTYGRTDMTKLIVAFHNFANAPKNAFEKPRIFSIRTESSWCRPSNPMPISNLFPGTVRFLG